MAPKISNKVKTDSLNQEKEASSDTDQDDSQESSSEGDKKETQMLKSTPIYSLRRREVHKTVTADTETKIMKVVATETVTKKTEAIITKRKYQGSTKKPGPSRSTFGKKQFSIAMMVAVLLALLYHFGILRLNSQESATSSPLDVAQIIGDLQDKFSDQPKLTFNIIRASLRNVAKSNPTAPAIIMLLASRNAKDTTEMFATELVNSISKSPIVIDGNQSLTKLDVEQKINNGLNNLSEIGVVFLKNLDSMDRESASILHTFCDHQNANYKRAAYVMTVFTEEVIPAKFDSKIADEVALKRLSGVWNMSKYADQVSSLLARITVSVAPVLS